MSSETPLYYLPNELLLHIFALLPTPTLLPLTTVSHRVYALILRILHYRMLIASRLDEHTLLLECYHPSAKLTEPPLFCTNLGTDGLDALAPGERDNNGTIPRLGELRNMYTRFRPYRRSTEETNSNRIRRHPAGDVPGSRTHPSSQPIWNHNELVKHTISLEGHELFSQLCAVTNLVKLGPRNGIFRSFVTVEEGVVRVWRDWLDRRATSGAKVGGLQEDEEILETGEEGGAKLNSKAAVQTNKSSLRQEDDSIVWINSDRNTGLRFRVTERRFRRDMPILVAAAEDVPVSYEIHYEELFVRTSQLLLMIERSFAQQDNNSGKAVVFGTFG